MATGHKLMKEITDQFLHCKICYEPYKDPKTLVCLHTFCLDCIQKHVDSDSSRSSRFLLYNRYVSCPLCRSKTEIPTGGVKRLQDNFLVSSLTDALNRKRISKNPPCDICPRERPKGNNASHKCLDCAKLLCKGCMDLHLTTKVTQGHSLIDIEGEKDIECKNHPEEIVRYYCEPCEECICVVCTFQEHRDHEICSFSDGFTKYKSGLDGLFSQCKDRLKDVQGRLETMQKVETSLKDTRENIRDLAISYIQQVRAAERQLMQRVEDEFGGNVEGFLKNKEWLQENYDSLQTTCNLAEIIMNDKGVEMLLLKKDLQSKFSALLEPALPAIPDNLAHDLKFVPGNVTLGHISSKPEDEADLDGGSVKHHMDDETDGSRPKKRPCYTRDTQTDTGDEPATSIEMTFNISPPIVSHSTVTLNGYSTDTLCEDTNNQVLKTDVSVNTMQSMVDFCKSTSLTSDECLSPGVCVKCSAELKKDSMSSTGSLPVIDGNAPAIQDIIITNCDENNRSRQRRRRSLIRSRRTQTDLSLSSDSIEDALRVSSQESLNGSFRKYSNQNLSAVAECVITKSIGLDPIDFGYKYNTYARNKGVNTTENVKVVVDTRSVKTNTAQPLTRESSAMTAPDCRAIDTQTLDKITVNKCIATDYAGQRNKRTSTPIIITMDSSTCMPSITQESKVTWTDAVQTTERSVATEAYETTESFTEPMKPQICDQGVGVAPETRTIETNTDPVYVSTKDPSASPKERKSKTKDKEKKEKTEKSGEKKEKEKKKKEKREKKKMVDSCVETDPVLRSDKDTGTVTVPLKDSWTTTTSPTMVNTGVTPARPATREASVATNTVAFMDQATYTEVVKKVDNTTETVIVTCEGETLTEKIGCQDAQTNVDVYSEDADTNTDSCVTADKGCTTDAEWIDDNDREVRLVLCEQCEETRTVVDIGTSPITDAHEVKLKHLNSLISSETQTVDVQFYDKAVICELEGKDGFNGATFSDMSTSTENLPYIGLLSDMDCDELILVPEVAIDMIGSDLEYEKLYNNSFPVPMSEASAQTEISSATLDIDLLIACEAEFGPDLIKPVGGNLVNIGVNTEQKLTFEKETCTTMFHLFSIGTNTHHIEKADKSTCTGSHVRAMQEALTQSPAPDRSSRIHKPVKKDVCVETDPTMLDEKMIACINKLKTVSERLNSPTRKTAPETPWSKDESNNNNSADNLFKDLDKATESERKKNVMQLVAKTQAITKPKEPKTEPVKRKAQPLTTLKGRYQDKLETDETKPQSVTVAQEKPVVQSPKTPNNSRRNNSAPPRIATVPNQAIIRKSPKVPPKTPIHQTNGAKSDQSATLPSSTKQEKQDQGPEFYSTVPKTRHPRLPMITESRPSSIGSEASTASFRSAVSDQRPSSTSSDKTLDFSSLKINAPPRQASVSPTPPRRSTQKESRPGRSSKKPTIEVTPTPEDSPRTRHGSSSSDLTDNEPTQEKKGFMKKLFGSKKKKGADKRNLSPSKSPKPGRKALAVVPPPPQEEEAHDKGSPKDKDSPKEKPKDKPKPFVYMRSRIFSIEQKDDDKYNKPIVNKYCMDEEKPPVFDFAATFTKK